MGNNSHIELAENMLQKHYIKTLGPIAFIDESYRFESRNDDTGFYLVGAMVVDHRELPEVRSLFEATVGGNFWHTTEANSQKRFSDISRFLSLIVELGLASFIALQTRILNNDLERARQICLAQLLVLLDQRKVPLVVLEQRESQRERSADNALFSRALKSELVSRDMRLTQTSPRIEPLLWGADLICWAVRRHIALSDSKWVKKIHTNVSLIDVTPMTKSADAEAMRLEIFARNLTPALHPEDLAFWLEREFGKSK
jgi:hypothetical protein